MAEDGSMSDDAPPIPDQTFPLGGGKFETGTVESGKAGDVDTYGELVFDPTGVPTKPVVDPREDPTFPVVAPGPDTSGIGLDPMDDDTDLLPGGLLELKHPERTLPTRHRQNA
jgi:hypothetical protein